MTVTLIPKTVNTKIFSIQQLRPARAFVAHSRSYFFFSLRRRCFELIRMLTVVQTGPTTTLLILPPVIFGFILAMVDSSSVLELLIRE
jgi:hypothetical protein